MKTIYIDADYICHVSDTGDLTAVETDFFDGKCDAFVEGYRLVPEGSAWTRSDGKVFRGLMIAPWKDYRILQAYQEQYEAMSLDAETHEKAKAYDVMTGVTE